MTAMVKWQNAVIDEKGAMAVLLWRCWENGSMG